MIKRKAVLFVLLNCSLLISVTRAQTKEEQPYQIGAIIFKDDFNSNLNNWISEVNNKKDSKVAVENGKLLMDISGGATVWLNKKLSGNIIIEFKRKVIMNKGKNDRLSDLNQFWMSTDPRNENLFTRTGTFSEYDSLKLYYVGMGGNTNSTTRFRKYEGDGRRTLLAEQNDDKHLLEPNKEYLIKIIVYNGQSKFFVDGEEYFDFKDPYPLTEGYFGFRTVQSRQEIDDFKVYKLN